MNYESNSIWNAMKEVHYKRTITNLEKGIRESKDLKAALGAALDVVVHAAKAEAGTFWFFDRDVDGRIRPFAVYGGGDLGDFSLSVGEGIAGKVIENGKAVIIEDCTSDQRWQGKADKKTGFVTKSMIAVPLQSEDYVFGCIQIINKQNNEFFDPKDLAFVKQLAEFTAVMFQNLGFIAKGNQSAKVNQEVTFVQLLMEKNVLDMELKLRTIKEFSSLGVKNQQHIISHMKEVYTLFKKNRG